MTDARRSAIAAGFDVTVLLLTHGSASSGHR